MKASDIKFRCSSLGYIMTEPKSKAEGELSDTCRTHLVDVYLSAVHSRREELNSKFLSKGNEREEDSITLLSRLLCEPFKKNETRIENSYLSGEPDLYLGPEIMKAEETLDTKTSWSAHTFYRAKFKKLDPKYKWQGVGYMALTGAKKHSVAYCLVNGTEKAIQDEKRALAYRLGCFGIDGNLPEEYILKAQQIERNHIFELSLFVKEYPWFEFDTPQECTPWPYDIPREDRVFLQTFERSESDIAAVYRKINFCRDWMKSNLPGLT